MKKNKNINNTGILSDSSLPVIGGAGTKKKIPKIIVPGEEPKPVLTESGMEKFARKPNETMTLDKDILSKAMVIIPPIYYWEDVTVEGKSELMTMAFKWGGRNWGLSFPIETENFVAISMQRKKLFTMVKESLDVLIHHGQKIFDETGNIDPRKINDEEAIRWKFDPLWKEKVAAFNHLVRIAPITREKAQQLGLLDKDPSFSVL